MKKLLVFMAMMTLALGAWAYNYNFTLTVTCPTSFDQMSKDGGYYLVNTVTKTVYAYWKGDEWTVEQKEGTTYLGLKNNTSHAAVNDNSFSVEGTVIQGYNVIAQDYPAGKSTVDNEITEGDPTKTVIFGHRFTSDTLVDLDSLGTLSRGKYSDLAVIVYDHELGIDESYKVGATGYVADGEEMHFTAAGTMTPVPEPTSGMLFLLGLAGLSLRRRRVA